MAKYFGARQFEDFEIKEDRSTALARRSDGWSVSHQAN